MGKEYSFLRVIRIHFGVNIEGFWKLMNGDLIIYMVKKIAWLEMLLKRGFFQFRIVFSEISSCLFIFFVHVKNTRNNLNHLASARQHGGFL